ncbi:MAG: serine/threonine-protein kinase [Myxococcales bacterium]|nr:serine/threonine-protein kinase [Myxococcales bacterium]
MEQTSEIRVGVVLAETYEITDLLGQGGMGAVWAAKHLRLPGKRVAIKVLHGIAASDRESFARFRREAEIATRIGHPNIVTVHDFNVLASGTPYLVLEYLEGEDLAARLLRGKIPVATALGISRQIGSALHAAHKHDVVHRDLKPANVWLMATEIGGELVDQVKVLDFGISKIRGSQTVQTQDAVLLGTPQYMAPEQALGKNTELDGRTDIFALGAIVYEMLSGQPAFMGSTLAEVVFKVVYDKHPPLTDPELPKSVVDAVEQALAKDPAMRFSDVAAFINALTGRPLQTLDRARVNNAAPEAFASTKAALPSGVAPQGGGVGLATTGARGEVSRAIPATTGPKPGGSDGKKAAFIAGALLAVIAGAVGVIKLTAKPPAEPAARPPAVATTATLPPKIATTPSGAEVAPSGAAVAPSGVAVAPSGHKLFAATPKGEGKPPKAGKGETVPPEIAADLESAEKAIDSDAAEAIRVARRTMGTAKTSRAFSIVARAFCKQGNLGDAKAQLHSVSGSDRARVLKYCKSVGTDLQ